MQTQTISKDVHRRRFFVDKIIVIPKQKQQRPAVGTSKPLPCSYTKFNQFHASNSYSTQTCTQALFQQKTKKTYSRLIDLFSLHISNAAPQPSFENFELNKLACVFQCFWCLLNGALIECIWKLSKTEKTSIQTFYVHIAKLYNEIICFC